MEEKFSPFIDLLEDQAENQIIAKACTLSNNLRVYIIHLQH